MNKTENNRREQNKQAEAVFSLRFHTVLGLYIPANNSNRFFASSFLFYSFLEKNFLYAPQLPQCHPKWLCVRADTLHGQQWKLWSVMMTKWNGNEWEDKTGRMKREGEKKRRNKSNKFVSIMKVIDWQRARINHIDRVRDIEMWGHLVATVSKAILRNTEIVILVINKCG